MFEFLSNNISTINFVLINISLGLSIYITLATGLLSLANAGFMAIGAYTVAIIQTQTHIPFSFGFVMAIALGVTLALPIGIVALGLRDIYLAIATLGFGEIVRIIALNGDKVVRLFSTNKDVIVFNGAEGITLAYKTPTIIFGLPDTTWPILIYCLVAIYILATLHNSRYGRILASIRQDETAASTLGINVARYKLFAFVLGSAIAAGAGALGAPIVRVVDPHNYVFSRGVDILAYAVLGGMTHWVGPILGATVLTSLPEALRFLKDQRDIVNGLIIMLSIIYLPAGLADPRVWTIPRKLFALLGSMGSSARNDSKGL